MFANGPTIVTNGLVLALDAGDKNSYVSGSTTWFDLTGVNNGTLTNGPTFDSGSGGSIVFDGTNDYVTGSSSNLSEYTLCAMVKVLAYKIGGGILGGTNTANAYLQIGGSNNWQFNNAFIFNNTPVLSQWAYINGVQTSTSTQLLYLNGNLVTSTSGTSNLGTGYVIGRRELSSVYLNCQIGLAQIYNRALTASEVLQNYNATKGRFGLT
jgi:hypothetical protein